MVLSLSSADCGASAPALTASSSASTSCLFIHHRLPDIRNRFRIIRPLVPCLQCCVDDLLERDAMFEGSRVAVFVLGLGVGDVAVEDGSFDADLAVRRDDGCVRAIEGAALLGAAANTEGGGLAEEQFFEARCVGGAAEDGDGGA